MDQPPPWRQNKYSASKDEVNVHEVIEVEEEDVNEAVANGGTDAAATDEFTERQKALLTQPLAKRISSSHVAKNLRKHAVILLTF